MTEAASKIVSSIVSSLFDPSPIRFRDADERGVGPVRRACVSRQLEMQRLRRPLNRNAFLCGCLDYTEREAIEHLIVGLGNRHGSTTRVSAVVHVVGSEHRVGVPLGLQRQLDQWLNAGWDHEIIVFHNHPPNDVNVLFDNQPLASSPDRAILLSYYARPLVALKAFLDGGRIRFYLGENGFVREFRVPDVAGTLDGLRHP